MNKKMIDALRKKAEQNRQALDSMQTQRTQLIEEHSRAKAAAELVDDADAYAKIKQSMRALEDKIEFLERQARKTPYVTKDDAIAAWKDYAAGYNKELAAKIQNMQKARDDLKRAFAEAIALQNEALKDRQEVAALANMTKENVYPGQDPLPSLPMNLIPLTQHAAKSVNGSHVPELSYFISAGIWPDNVTIDQTGARSIVFSVAERYTPVDDLTPITK